MSDLQGSWSSRQPSKLPLSSKSILNQRGEPLIWIDQIQSKVNPRDIISSHIQRSQEGRDFFSGERGKPAQFHLGCLHYALLSSLHRHSPTHIREAYLLSFG